MAIFECATEKEVIRLVKAMFPDEHGLGLRKFGVFYHRQILGGTDIFMALR
jgi:hypothetical protein